MPSTEKKQGLRFSLRSQICTAALLAGLAAMPQLAYAQGTENGAGAPSPNQLDEVLVTARRVSESQQEIPVAVSTVSPEKLRTESIARPEDLPRVAPGLTVSPSPRGSSAPNYLIRGQRGAFNPSTLTDPAVGVYFADVNQTRSVGTNQNLFDLESVQVIKGPQGTLFGRNSTGGAILFTPKAPSDEFEGYVQVSAGDYEFYDFEGVVNIPLGSKVALRGGMKATEREGYMTNVLDGRKADDLDNTLYRLSVAFQPTDTIRSTFIGVHSESKEVGLGAKLIGVDPAGIPASLGGLAGAAAGILGAELAATRALGDYEFRGNPDLQAKDKVMSLQNTTEIDLGDITLKNIIGYRNVTAKGVWNLDGSSKGWFDVFNHVSQDAISEEFQIQGSVGKLDYIVGAFYTEEESHEVALGQLFGLFSALPPPPPFALLFPVGSNYDIDIDTRSMAGFVHFDYGLTDALTLSGGVRLTRDERKVVWHNIDFDGVVPGGFECVLTATALPGYDTSLCSVPSETLESTEPTYDISLSYQATDDLLLYLAHRRGYRSGSFNQTPFALVNNNRTFDPEFVDDIEAGLKSDFLVGNMAGRLNVAGYYQFYKDIQRTVFVQNPLTTRTGSQIVNAAKADIYGGEAELTLRPTEQLELSANYAYIHPEYKEWNDTVIVGSTLQTVDISDSKFGFVPTHQWSVNLSYTLPVPEDRGDVLFSLTWYGQSKMASADTFTSNCAGGLYPACLNSSYYIPAYDLGNFRMQWSDFAGQGFDVSLFVNNIADTYYVNHATNVLGLLGTNSVGVGAPRMMGVNVRVPFGAERY